jgi:hypothetical protein
MTDIAVSYENVMVESYDGESPWRCGVHLDPQIVKWLDDHCGPNWDWEFSSSKVVFRIQDDDIAMLFKLTWG